MELVSVHIFALAVTALIIIYSDHEGFSYIRGTKALLSTRFLFWSHTLVWCGLLVMIVTGAIMVFPIWTYYFQNPAFFVKMGFVAVLIVNAYAIGVLSKTAAERKFVELTKEEKRTLFISGALSSVGWIGAALVGFLFL